MTGCKVPLCFALPRMVRGGGRSGSFITRSVMENTKQKEGRRDEDKARYRWEGCDRAVNGRHFNNGWGPGSFRELDPSGFEEVRSVSLFDRRS